jgi:hypothetical protein
MPVLLDGQQQKQLTTPAAHSAMQLPQLLDLL